MGTVTLLHTLHGAQHHRTGVTGLHTGATTIGPFLTSVTLHWKYLKELHDYLGVSYGIDCIQYIGLVFYRTILKNPLNLT